MSHALTLSFVLPVVGLGIGGLAGALAHAFARRWPRPRSVAPGSGLLVAIGALVGLVLAVLGPEGREVIVPALLAGLLLPITLIDLELRLIPDVLTLPGAGLCLGASALLGGETLALVGWSMAAAAFFALPAAALRGSVGWGDVKLAALLGAALGSGVVWALAVGLCLGGVWAMVLLARKGCAARSHAIPLAPALATGALAVLLLA